MGKLDRQLIIDAALAIIEAEGEAGLAMRPLAAQLGVTPMALYRHFADRDALLLALVERVSDEISIPSPALTPSETAVGLALCLHDFLVRHPWMIRLISAGRLASPAGLRFPEGFLACAANAGLDEEEGFLFYRTMFAAILGQATITSAKERAGVGADIAVDTATADTPAVQSLAARWRDLDASSTPAAIFHAVASQLPPHRPSGGDGN